MIARPNKHTNHKLPRTTIYRSPQLTNHKSSNKCRTWPDMEFVQNFTPPDFQAKNFTPPISPNFNSFSKKKHKKLVKMEKFTPLATNFTLPPGLMGWTNSTSVRVLMYFFPNYSPSPGRESDLQLESLEARKQRATSFARLIFL